MANLELRECLEVVFPFFLSLPFPFLLPLPLPFPCLSLPFFLLSLSLRSGPLLNPARGSRERCKLPHWGLGRSGAEPHPKWNVAICFSFKMWHLVATFQWSTYHRFCISLQAYLGEHYCITISPGSDIIWRNGVPQKIFGGTALPRVPLDYTTAC